MRKKEGQNKREDRNQEKKKEERELGLEQARRSDSKSVQILAQISSKESLSKQEDQTVNRV